MILLKKIICWNANGVKVNRLKKLKKILQNFQHSFLIIKKSFTDFNRLRKKSLSYSKKYWKPFQAGWTRVFGANKNCKNNLVRLLKKREFTQQARYTILPIQTQQDKN